MVPTCPTGLRHENWSTSQAKLGPIYASCLRCPNHSTQVDKQVGSGWFAVSHLLRINQGLEHPFVQPTGYTDNGTSGPRLDLVAVVVV